MKNLKYAVLVLGALLLTGCGVNATLGVVKSMGLLEEEPIKPISIEINSDSTLKSGKSIVLVTLTMKKDYIPSYQLDNAILKFYASPKRDEYCFSPSIGLDGFENDCEIVYVSRASGEVEKKEIFNKEDGSNYFTYLVSMKLEPGKYYIDDLLSYATVNKELGYKGFFKIDINEKINVTSSGVYYLGNIDATLVENKENKPSASLHSAAHYYTYLQGIHDGTIQSKSGAFGGTFDIEITDQWEKDKIKYINKFPALGKVNVKKTILPPYDFERMNKRASK